MSFEIHMKPTGMSKFKNGVRRVAEYVVTVTTDDKNEAAAIARSQAEAEGFGGYAITKIKEVTQ